MRAKQDDFTAAKKAGFKPKTSSVSYNVEEVKMKILLRAL